MKYVLIVEVSCQCCRVSFCGRQYASSNTIGGRGGFDIAGNKKGVDIRIQRASALESSPGAAHLSLYFFTDYGQT